MDHDQEAKNVKRAEHIDTDDILEINTYLENLWVSK